MIASILKTLVARSSEKEQLLRFFSPELAEEVQSQPTPSEAATFESLLSATRWLEPIHYSWYCPILEPLPKETQALFLSILPSKTAKHAADLLKIPLAESAAPSKFMVPYLSYFLKNQMQLEEVVAEEHLPPSEMNVLLNVPKRVLMQVIDFLGIYDVAADLRQVVDKTLLDRVYSSLSEKQLHFLHYCTKQPLKWAPPKIGLSSWSGSGKQLNQIIHQRGLMRLARATWEEGSSFRWHLLHHLDTGRAKFMQKVYLQKQDPTLTPYFKKQVLHILNMVQPQ